MVDLLDALVAGLNKSGWAVRQTEVETISAEALSARSNKDRADLVTVLEVLDLAILGVGVVFLVVSEGLGAVPSFILEEEAVVAGLIGPHGSADSSLGVVVSGGESWGNNTASSSERSHTSGFDSRLAETATPDISLGGFFELAEVEKHFVNVVSVAEI